MNKSAGHIIGCLGVSLMILFAACNPAKKLKENEYLLNKNRIKGNLATIDKGELQNYIRIKPNYKLLGIAKLNLWLYNLANEERISRKQEIYAKKRQQKNERRLAKGKKPRQRQRKVFGERLLNTGEAPMEYDSMMVKKSAEQLKFYLDNKSYFSSSVKDSVVFRKKRKADVYYLITLNNPYKINDITYEINDRAIQNYLRADSINCLIKKGRNYDLDIIQQERERIVYYLNNQGYYLFTKEFIHFKVDTISNSGSVNIAIIVRNNTHLKQIAGGDSLVEENHRRFFINNIYIEPNFSNSDIDTVIYDTLVFKYAGGQYKILNPSRLTHKPKVLADAIFLYQNDSYQVKNVEATYRRLSELRAFKYVNVVFKQLSGDSLDCYIQLSSLLKQSVALETEGTNASNNLGISGNIVYQNKNLLKGAEVLELRLRGGVAAQRIFNEEQRGLTSNTSDLNTIEFGPEVNLYVPRFLLPFHVPTYRRSNPKTVFTSGLNYQRRPDYFRVITNFALSYTWRENLQKRHSVSPLVLDFVKVDLSPSFEQFLYDRVRNRFIINSFVNHVTTSTRYVFTYSEQDLSKQKSFSYFRGSLESSGNLLRGIYNLTNQLSPNTFKQDSLGSYTIMGIAYSQYLRSDVDYRYYWNIGDLGRVVFRVAGGYGKPLTNFRVLPFERSFFSGGANGLRAWQARTIGPGSYFNPIYSYDRLGDVLFEANVEHRFKIFKMLHGAVFIDAGNVWLQSEDASRLGGDFKMDRFYKEIALGTGFGLRADFNFFIIRLDVGLKAHDPQFAENERWVLQRLFNSDWKRDFNNTYGMKYNFSALNLGIGYPF